MDDNNLTFLRELLDSPGPSGFETRPATVWRSAAASIADSVDRDVLGNSYARLENPGKPVAIIEGHIDEIGLMITHVDEQGYLWFDRIGGWDIQILLGQRVIVLGPQGDIAGVIGRQAAHLLKDSEREKAPQISDLWIDIGAASRDQALTRVQVGDPAVLDLPFCQVSDDRIVSRSIDNRVGAYVALRSLQMLAKSRPSGVEAVALAATQEETSFAGASTATFSLQPAVSVVIDVTHATDYPSADKRRDGEISIGGGPVLSRGPSLNPIAFEMIRDIAKAREIPIQLQGAPRTSGTDADAMFMTGRGVPCVLVSIPNRYMHSPNEMVSLNDLEQASSLIAAFIASVNESTDFRP